MNFKYLSYKDAFCKNFSDQYKFYKPLTIKEIGIERKYWFGLNTYFYELRTEALKEVKDSKDFKTLHKKVLELFDRDMKSKGKDKLGKYVINLAEEIKKKRSKK